MTCSCAPSSSKDSYLQREQLVDLNCIHVNPQQPDQFAVGGDEEACYVYDARFLRPTASTAAALPTPAPVARYCPAHLVSERKHPVVHITACVFSRRGELLVSYNDDDVYLFDPRAARTGQSVRRRCAIVVGEVRRRKQCANYQLE